jgi:hypothetical protein
MKNLYKYLFFLVLGIILYILLNGKNKFSVGIPEYLLTIEDDSINIVPSYYSDDQESWAMNDHGSLSSSNPVIKVDEKKYYVYGDDSVDGKNDALSNYETYIESRQSMAGGGAAAAAGGGAAAAAAAGGGAGGGAAAAAAAGGVLIPGSLPLSIQIHEFALFVHYQLRRDNPEFTFYVQPEHYMDIVLKKYYGLSYHLAHDQRYEPEELENIRKISGGKLPSGDGTSSTSLKIPFEAILQRYKGIVPELYQFEIVGNSYNSYTNKYGFQLLDKREKENKDNILAFHNVVRKYFCNISVYEKENYIRKLKTKYPKQNWEDYGTMARKSNLDIPDVLEFLKYMINNTEEKKALRILVQNYVDIFSTEMHAAIHCEFGGIRAREMDLDGTYMIVKLKDPELGFVYDNTEMVVSVCNFELGIPAQYHIRIMRNPSDLIDRKFRKIFTREKYDAIISLNAERGMFTDKRIF